MSDTVHLRLVLDVTYTANGVSPKSLAENLDRMVRNFVGDGGMTGESDAEVESWDANVAVLDAEQDVNAWVQRLEALGVDESALDDAVHDVASDVGSTVNNGGLRSQVAFLLAYGDVSVIKAAARPAGLESDELDPALPACLLTLSEEQRAAVSDALSNWEETPDGELEAWFIDQVKVSPEQAKALIAVRPKFLVDPAYELFPQASA